MYLSHITFIAFLFIAHYSEMYCFPLKKFMDISTREYNWGTVLEPYVYSRGIISREDEREKETFH